MASAMNVILIGETGSGKSTFINYLTNFFLQGTLSRLRVAIPTRHLQPTERFVAHENAINDNTQSKTNCCQDYSFEANGQSYLFIDTPGLSDTNGIQQDDTNLQNIFERLQQLYDLTAVLLIVNGAQARMTVNIKNVIIRLQERLPNAITNNIIVILTNCQQYSVNFEPRVFGLPSHCTIFYMQNSAFSTHPKTWDSSARTGIETNWEKSMNVIQNLIKHIRQLKPVSTHFFTDMQDERNAIKSLLHGARVLIHQFQQLEDEIVILEQASHKYGENSMTFQNFEREAEIPFQEIVDVNYYNTICTRCTCVCHERCSLDETHKMGDKSLKDCAVMKAKRCTVCPERCSYKDHYHDHKGIRQGKQKVKVILNDMKHQFMNANSNKRNCDSSRERYKEATTYIEQCIQTQYTSIATSCHKLNDMCLGFNVVEELVETITFLERDVQALKSAFAQKKGKAFINRLEELCRELHRKSPITKSSSTSPPPAQGPPLPVEMKEDDEVARLTMPLSLLTHRQTTPFFALSVKPTTTDDKYIPHELFRTQSIQLAPMNLPTSSETNTLPSQHLYNAEPRSPLQEQYSSLSALPSGLQPLPNGWTEWSVERLVDVFKNPTELIKDDRTAIRKELTSRSRGKSIGYLSPENLYQLCKQVVEHQTINNEVLHERQDSIQEKIDDLLDGDIANLGNVPMELVLKLVAITMALKMLKDKR